MFVTGPAVIESVTGEKVSMEELGGARQQARNGNVSYVAGSEEEAFNYVKDLMEFLPSSVFDDPQEFWAPSDELTERDCELSDIIPDDPNAGYDIMDVLTRIFDDDNVLEAQEDYYRTWLLLSRALKVAAWAWSRTNRWCWQAALMRMRRIRPPASSGSAMRTTSRSCGWWILRATCRAWSRRSWPHPPWRQAGFCNSGSHCPQSDRRCAQGLRRRLRSDGLEEHGCGYQLGIPLPRLL